VLVLIFKTIDSLGQIIAWHISVHL